MDFDKIGEKIRKIREEELKQTREEFAEEIGISIHTASRLENATSKVSNIEVFVRISEISGYTLDELILDKNYNKEKEKNKRKINHLLNYLTQDELTYIYGNLKNFVKYIRKNRFNNKK